MESSEKILIELVQAILSQNNEAIHEKVGNAIEHIKAIPEARAKWNKEASQLPQE